MCDLEAEKLVIKFIEVPTVSENDLPEWLGILNKLFSFLENIFIFKKIKYTINSKKIEIYVNMT